MKKLQFTDEATFKTEEIEFTDDHFELADELYEKFGYKNIPIMVRNDKKSLMFCIDKSKNRLDREIGNHTYRITIEKINQNV